MNRVEIACVDGVTVTAELDLNQTGQLLNLVRGQGPAGQSTIDFGDTQVIVLAHVIRVAVTEISQQDKTDTEDNA